MKTIRLTDTSTAVFTDGGQELSFVIPHSPPAKDEVFLFQCHQGDDPYHTVFVGKLLDQWIVVASITSVASSS